MALSMDILELACHLRQERLYVNTERENLQRLNEDVKKVAKGMYHSAWLAKQQRSILDALIRSSQDATPAECCSRINQLDYVSFVDSYKYLSYHDTKYGEFLKILRESPKLLARCIACCEKDRYDVAQSLVRISMSSIYGNCVMQEDETFALQLLKTLLELQVSNHMDPRRLIRKGTCSFSLVFKQFFDNLFPAKLFLTAALHEPVMRLLMEDEWFYDIDPDKAVIRFPPTERIKRFGQAGTDEYKAKLATYRKFIVDKLVSLSMRFVQSIKNNLHCFPSSLIWIVSQVFHCLSKSERVGLADIRSTCADLVFGLFICPAICDPEPYGITSDVPISHIARHNLMQIAQIIQLLAISRFEDIDPKVRDLYGRFDKGCMSNVLDAMLDGTTMELPSGGQGQPYSRAAVLITQTQLAHLITYLRSAVPLLEDSGAEKKQLEELLSPLPNALPLLNSQTSTPSQTPPGTPNMQKKALRSLKKRPSHAPADDPTSPPPEDSADPEVTSAPKQPEEVLVISLGQNFDCPGMLSEQKVLSLENETRRRRVKYQDVLSYDINVPGQEIQEKRTRFSLSHDQESIGNTSDIPEAVSEAASSHSVGSVDLENDNDNFSDMLSANVSGRGTPNISGRDTPLSQAESVEDRRAPDLPETVQKSNREDVTDRFGKFDIRPELERDEAKSTVSETWSTDVLASDSEPPEQNQMERLEEVTEEIVRQNLLPEPAGEVSETASESAWSTDVLASDTDDKQSELLTDLDDISSVEERSRPGDDDRDLDVLDSEDNQGDENKEDTPQASGGQSPSEDRLLDSVGVVGGREAIYRNKRAAPRVCNSDPATAVKSDADYDRHEFPVDRQHRSVSEIVQNYQIKSSSPFTINKRQSDSLKAAQGKVPNILAAMEGDLPTPQHGHGGRQEQKYMYQGARPKIQIMGETTDSDIGTASPDLGYESPEGEKVDAKVRKHNFDLERLAQTDSGISDTPVEDYFAVTSPSADVLSADSVKLSEQQNTKLDAKRLSASLAMFDPLSPSTDDDADLLEGPDTSAGHTPLETGPALSSSNRSSQASMKSVIMADSNASGQIERQGILLPARHGNGAPLTEGQDLMTVNQEDGAGRRRDSSGSSQSTHSANLNDLSGSSPKAETVSQKSDEKDSLDIEYSSEHAKRKKGGFLNKVKEKIGKGMKKKGSKIDRDDVDSVLNQAIGEAGEFDGKVYIPGRDEPTIMVTETSDDILDKYRKKVTNGNGSPQQYDAMEGTNQRKDKSHMTKDDDTDDPPFYDPNNIENCYAFQDAKRKLRLVLSTGDFQMGVCIADLLFPSGGQLSPREHDLPRHDNDLVKLLRMQLAEAINLQDKDLIAQLHEAIRCVRLFDTQGCKKLLKALQEEYRVRSAYIAYLVRCRQGLLLSLSQLQRLHSRIKRDKEVCYKHFTNVCVRLFIESKEKAVLKFMSDFQKLTVSDEKTDLVERFLQFLYSYMEKDAMWQAASESQLEDARLTLERFLMSRIYSHAMFPNGDGDVLRDQILNKHIRRLSQIITPNHRDMRIPRMYHHECPWPAAQREIFMINAYKTPKDKLQCVIRCSTTIMNLLSLANEKSVPAADDFTPVLIYVIIKANPPGLLSTIQYVNSFYENRLAGEEQYWWMQFSSAIEFIKTMEYVE